MIPILISRCLLGDKVRYDGGDCFNSELHLLLDHLKPFPVCPEVQAGLSIPREPIELKQGRIINIHGDDITESFDPVQRELKALIEKESIKYALFKEDSPSCGVNTIYDGSFQGDKINGSGYITDFIRALGLKVFSEQEIESLKKALNI